jgi:tetratricopeptide (TPR) repeat protein
MEQTNRRTRRGIGCLLVYPAIVLSLCGNVRPQDAAVSIPWHEQSAALRFRIEKDDARSFIPNVSLFDLETAEKSADVRKWAEKNRWSDKRRINGQLCLNFVPAFGTTPIIYNLHKDFTHFVARAAIVDGADPNTSVAFEVYADKRLISRAGPLTRESPVAEIQAGIPVRSKQLKLVVKAEDNNHLGWAKWVDPGFLLRGAYPKVSCVRIHAPGYNLDDFVPQVYAPSSGAKVNSRILSAGRGEPMDILFDSTEAHPSYLVYLTPKDGRATPPGSWQVRAGIVLETRWAKSSPPSSDKPADLMKLFDGGSEPVGRSLVETIHHAFPIHRIPEYDPGASSRQGGAGLYYYKGFFPVDKQGNYSFATISRDDSYLAVDDKLVASWPGKHDVQGGIRGEKKGTVSLEPGIHKLEYFHFGQWGEMFAAAAWKKPNEELRIMTRTDFVPVGWYKVASAGFDDPNKAYAGFEWSVADDFRLEQTGRCFVTMRFEAIRPNPLVRYDCRWTFDDGTTETGEKIEHVFLRPALRKVHLEVALEGKLLAQADQEVHVHPAWDRSLTQAVSAEAFDKVIRERNLDKAPAEDLVNLFILAEEAERPGWKSLATAALAANVGRLVDESGDTDFFFAFGRYLQSAELKKYDEALELFSRLVAKPGANEAMRQRAAISQAETLVKYFGRNDEALKILDGLPMATAQAIMAKAEALAGLGRAKEAIDLLACVEGVPPSDRGQDARDTAKQQIKHAGLLRHARALAESKNDPNQLDQAMANLEMASGEDPVKILSPGLNLIKLDIHLARGEFRAAFHLAERLRHLQLNDYDIAEVLARQVVASCGLKDIEKAKSVYAQLSKDYPYSPALAQAKQAIIQTVGRQ